MFDLFNFSDVDADNEALSCLPAGDDFGTTNDLMSNLADVGGVFQMVSNADGSVAFVALDSSHLSSLLHTNASGMHDDDVASCPV